MGKAPTPEEIEAARAIVAAADERAQADRQAEAEAAKAKAEAAMAPVRELVASAEFKAALPAFEEALAAAPKDAELAYAVMMMDRLAARFPA